MINLGREEIKTLVSGWREGFRVPAAFEASTEARFLARYSRRFARMRRGSGALGLMLWCFNLPVEFTLMTEGESATAVIVVGIRVACAIALAVFFLVSLRPPFAEDDRHASRLAMGGCLVVGLSGAACLAFTPFPVNGLHFVPGMILVMVFFFSLFRLRARQGNFTVIVVAVAMEAAIWYQHHHQPAGTLPYQDIYPWISASLLAILVAVGWGIGVQLERSERQNFLDQEALAAAKAESEHRLGSLITAENRLREEAEQRNREKSLFLANAVHDLKQPLQAISNALFPAIHSYRTGKMDKMEEMINLAESAAKTMRHQLNAILDISRLESGVMQVDVVDFNITQIFSDAILQQTPVARAKSVALIAQVPDTPLYVRSDPAFIERILLNLIGNAIKYQDPDRRGEGSVVLAMRSEANAVSLSVTDNGLGIPEKELADGAIFEPFHQVNNRLPEHEKGVGLGLALVKEMVKLLPDHRIEVRSLLGEGSTFTLRLPHSAAPTDQAARAPAPSDEPFPDLSGNYILIVEDDPQVRQGTASLFESCRILHEAYDSYEHFAENIATIERVPDLILTDYRLPNGFTAIDVVQLARQVFPKIGVLIFSGEIRELPDLERVPGLSFLRKPLAPNELLRAIARQ